MKRLLFACSVVFAFGAMCTGAPTTDDGEATDDAPDKDKEVVIVPVPTNGDEEEHWCCEYQDDEGTKKFALVEGPSECNDKFADMDGRWVSGSQCTPCCCKSANDPDDDEKGFAFELTTPGACAGVGECVAAEGREECEEKGRDGDDKDPVERPIRKGPPVKPGSSGGAVRRPGGGDAGGGDGAGGGSKSGKGGKKPQ